MNAPFKQDARMGRLSTAIGKDKLNLLQFDGQEHVNSLFCYRVEALADTDAVDFDALIGTHATVHLTSFDLPEVPFDGVVSETQLLGPGTNGWRYELTLRPWLWLLSLRRKQQIYHNMTVVDIIEEVFGPYGKDHEFKLSDSYPVLEYTVQYGESDMAFVMRLMERFGINYHFTHSEGTHKLVLTDTLSAHDETPGKARPFLGVEDHHRAEEEHFWEMRPARRLTTGAIRLTDYNFKTPTAAMEAERAGDAAYTEGQLESYDYPGLYLDQPQGKGVARLRIDQERGQDPRHRGVGDCASLRAGQTVKVTGLTVPGVGEALCLSAQHSYRAGDYNSAGDDGGPSYEGRHLLMPSATPLRPEKKTPLARVQGPQTATVVGEGEIDCDEYGRILVHFHWDLEKRYSMRCRVSQNWAGNGWGGMVIPRIGMEVLVEFLEGDPDKPLVTGCVYNGKNDVPYPLPDNKTRSTFKTDTHQGTGFNELRFEDKNGAEEIYVHAQKDRNEKTLNNHSERIDNNWVQSVGHNKSIEVHNNHVESIGGNMSLTVGPSGIGQVVSGAVTGIAGGIGNIAKELGIPGALNPGEGNLQVLIEKVRSETIGLASTTMIGVSSSTTVGKSIEVTSGKTMGVTVGERSTESVGKTKSIDVGDELTITVGASRLIMKKDGTIQLIGKDIQFKASSNINNEAGSKMTVKAGGDIILKGSKVNMN